MKDTTWSENAASGSGRRLSRRRAMELVGLLGITAWSTPGCAAAAGAPSHLDTRVVAPPPKNVLGANFNGAKDWSDFGQLRDVSATWLRGFFPVPDADRGVVADQPVVRTVLSAAQQGYGTVLSLKFPYSEQPIPVPGSAAMSTALNRLDKVLPAVMGKVDILVVGNEPFIECRPEDRNTPQLNAFYEVIARRVIAFRDQHGGASDKTKLYMGALNRLNDPAWRTAATDRWMSFTRATAALDGVDIHPHVAAVEEVQAFLDYVVPRLRAGQNFLALEFSLVHHWRAHLSDPVSGAFAAKYGIPATTRVWEVIADAIRRPFTQQKWTDFLAMSPWFADRRQFLRNAVQRFRATGRLAVATYGVSQDAAMVANFGPESTPWLLNSMFCPYTVQPGPGGLPGRNTAWTTSFRDLQ
ncbi:hypothetical protein [Kibdelosporangium aridum]|uniref:Uncharacterized protein n=1 Tax=Kibdelosporangium aridum TaxID=2030 RepID=A0A1W2FM17_KIBAR|nr:hypothetical protein [Kibdelosporangium aridum]SMD22804.1 hypothetical protein SAMN05661093_07606 [Kibdelosporangium aridum]